MSSADISFLTSSSFQFDYPFKFERDFEEENAIQWMSQNWTLSITLSAVYVVVIFGLKYYMQRRPKYDLRTALIGWSAVLSIFSIIAAIRLMSEALYVFYNHGWEYTVCYPTIYYGDTAIWAFLFVASKAYELGDTVFIVLRKQPLIFLHWYHHVTVMIYSWYSYAYYYAPGRWYAAINSLVHSFMYTYYFLKAMRVRLPRWVNIFITSIQLLQMVFGIFVNLSARRVLDRGDFCHVTHDNINYSLLMYASYFLLFAHFFYYAYLKPKELPTAQDQKVHEKMRNSEITVDKSNGYGVPNGKDKNQ